MISTCFRRTMAAIFIIALFAPGTALTAPQRRPGLIAFNPVPRTDAGDWYGTWAYKSREQRILLWIREDSAGKPEFQIQYQSMGTSEAFTTDWAGLANYAVSGHDALFHLDAAKRDENTISGKLMWDLQFEKSGRRQAGQFEMYRGDDGRHLVLHFFNQVLSIRRGDKEASDESPSAWTFIKVSKRLSRWEEIF